VRESPNSIIASRYGTAICGERKEEDRVDTKIYHEHKDVRQYAAKITEKGRQLSTSTPLIKSLQPDEHVIFLRNLLMEQHYGG
jgi:hypothetical protein